jgi:hypothetical protein
MIAVAGCNKDQSAASGNAPASNAPEVAEAPATQPATAPSNQTPTATTQGVPAYIAVDDHRYEFPPAKLVWDPKDGRAMATLYSDDPRSALENKYLGNSFFLQMDMEPGADGKSIDGARWTYNAPGSNRIESPTGIFLQGDRWQLQPVKVTAELGQDASDQKITAYIVGEFLMFDSTVDSDQGKIVQVAARLAVQLVKK